MKPSTTEGAKMNDISDMYLLSTGEKSILVLPFGTNVNEIYNEAYSLDMWIDIECVEYSNEIFVEKLTTHKPTSIVKQILGVLSYGEERSVTYKSDQLNLRTLQTTAYRCAKNQGINVDTRFVFGQLVVTLKTVRFEAIDAMLKPLKVGQSTSLPLSMHSTTARLRSYVSSFGLKNEMKFKTVVAGGAMIVTRVAEIQSVSFGGVDSMFSDSASDFRKWLNIIPFDIKISANAFVSLSESYMRVLAHRTFGSCITIDADKNVLKKSLSKGVESGKCVIRCNGHILFAGETFDVDVINQLLKIHGKSYEDIA